MAPEKEACSLERVEGERAKERGEEAKQCEWGTPRRHIAQGGMTKCVRPLGFLKRALTNYEGRQNVVKLSDSLPARGKEPVERPSLWLLLPSPSLLICMTPQRSQSHE